MFAMKQNIRQPFFIIISFEEGSVISPIESNGNPHGLWQSTVLTTMNVGHPFLPQFQAIIQTILSKCEKTYVSLHFFNCQLLYHGFHCPAANGRSQEPKSLLSLLGQKQHNMNASGSKVFIKLKKKNNFYIPRNKNYLHLIAIIY